jgi:hypothetical protein
LSLSIFYGKEICYIGEDEAHYCPTFYNLKNSRCSSKTLSQLIWGRLGGVVNK